MTQNVTAGEEADDDLYAMECENLKDIMIALASLLENDPLFKVLRFLACSDEPASIRKIARNTRLSHKNVARFLSNMERVNLVETIYSVQNMKLYSLSGRAKALFKNIYKCKK